MGNNKNRLSVASGNGFQNPGFCIFVQSAGSLVQDQDGLVPNKRSGDGNPLGLAFGKAASLFVKNGLKAVGSLSDKAVRIRHAEALPEFFFAGVFLAGPEVVFNASGQEGIALGDIGYKTAGSRLCRLGIALFVRIDNRSPVRRQQGHKEPYQGGLASPGGTYYSYDLARLHLKVNVVQDYPSLLTIITERYVSDFHFHFFGLCIRALVILVLDVHDADDPSGCHHHAVERGQDRSKRRNGSLHAGDHTDKDRHGPVGDSPYRDPVGAPAESAQIADPVNDPHHGGHEGGEPGALHDDVHTPAPDVVHVGMVIGLPLEGLGHHHVGDRFLHEGPVLGFALTKLCLIDAVGPPKDQGQKGQNLIKIKKDASVDDKVDNPVSLYAATKKSNELLAHSYSKLYNIPSTGLRFFTVYGPAGRPDMFYFSATQKLTAGKTIQIFNYGNCMRDFTYVDDIVEGVIRVMQGAPEKKTGEDGLPLPPYAVYNIGGGTPENLLDYVSTLQEKLVEAGVLPFDYDFEGHRELVGMQPGDVPVTYADSRVLGEDYGFRPQIGIREGPRRFAQWYKNYYM